MEQAKIDELNKIYDDFLKEFPIQRLEKLSLDEYTNLEKNNSFCYWLETRTENLGSIWGAFSDKFGIYRCRSERKGGKKFISDGVYAWHKSYGDNAQEAFEQIRKKIIEIAICAKNAEFEKIDDIELLWPLYKWKIAFLYSNKKLLPIYQEKGLKWIAKKQGMEINPKVQISQIQAFLMSEKGNENIFSYAKRLWQEWQNSNEYKTSKNKNNDEIGDEMMENEFIDEIVKVLKYKKNIILQGAPGVGKTYNTAMIALGICDVNDIDFKDHKAVMAKYEELRKNGQIEFVTFHQSMDYEDFVEGIKPELNENDDNNTINYKVKKRIFRKICKRAKSQVGNNDCEIIDLSTTKIYKMSLGRYGNKEDIEIFKYCIKNNKIALGYSDEDNAFFKTFKYKIQKNKDIVVITNKEDEIRAICKVIGDLETKDSKEADNIRYDNFREVEWLWETSDKNDYITLDDKLDYKTIYELRDEKLKLITNKISKFQEKIDKYPNKSGKKYKLVLNGQNDNVVSQSNKNYVLIIDEINRGNVSKIFGELITLLESDKRLGAEHPIKLTLPYSKESFGIPDNLYIIGTMNTTDRSVGNIDYAVRRRFAFVTLPADESVLDKKELNENCIKLFNAIKKFVEAKGNNQGEFENDDLIVGHSYFMAKNENDLILKLKYEIIPLLHEYHKDGILKIKAPDYENDESIENYIKKLDNNKNIKTEQ